MGSGLWLGLGLGCVSLSLSVPGVSTARPAACADQPSRRSTACRGTRRGRPRRRWRARRPSRAAHRCPAYGDGSGPPGSYHPAAAVRSRRLAARSPCDESPSHGSVPRVAGTTGTRRTWPATQSGALAFKAPCELPALAVRRILRQHDCRHWLASDGAGGAGEESRTSRQARPGRQVSA